MVSQPAFETSFISAVILAAGLGTRMKSQKAKVLHEIMEKPMILYVVETARQAVGNSVVLVVGHQAEKVKSVVSEQVSVDYAFQEKQLGTGHAVLCALPMIPDETQHVVILCGDVPLLKPETVRMLLNDHVQADRDLSLLAVDVKDPAGYGRVLFDDQRNLLKIVEHADATERQKEVHTINSGIYCVKKAFLADSLKKINTDNAQGELYLTDIIGIGYQENKILGVSISNNEAETIGVNSREDLARVEALMNR